MNECWLEGSRKLDKSYHPMGTETARDCSQDSFPGKLSWCQMVVSGSVGACADCCNWNPYLLEDGVAVSFTVIQILSSPLGLAKVVQDYPEAYFCISWLWWQIGVCSAAVCYACKVVWKIAYPSVSFAYGIISRLKTDSICQIKISCGCLAAMGFRAWYIQHEKYCW